MSAEVSLSKDEILRYSRHLILPEVGMEGQLKLKAASVLLVGTGGLGAPLGLYLAAAGVGHIGLVDFDVVDFTNLQRQVIHHTSDVGRKKLDSAADKMLAINPFLKIPFLILILDIPRFKFLNLFLQMYQLVEQNLCINGSASSGNSNNYFMFCIHE